MSGDRQWTLIGSPGFQIGSVIYGALEIGEEVRVVEASRLTAVEAERDALREVVGWVHGGFAPGEPRRLYGDATTFLDEVKKRTGDVLARFPKNETEQG